MSAMPEQANDSRLRWRCRRGMLELDLLLNQFLDHGYQKLDKTERNLLDEILDYPDQLLFDLLLGHMPSSNKDISNIVSQIRHTATS
ncbi:MAG: succinate dehydrogenase assembly factor 2 [Gammaproteobacteria bacterium]|nr:succinate dehydrogenase assembly factor 2 [Gammaproteobacteria bacterium]